MGPNWKRVVLLFCFLYRRETRAECGIPCIYRFWINVVSTATTASGKETSRASSDLFDQFVDFERGSFWCRNIIGFCFSSFDLSFHSLVALVEWLFRVAIRFGINWRFGKVLDRLMICFISLTMFERRSLVVKSFCCGNIIGSRF